MRRPTGPPPVTSTRSSVSTPDSSTACRAIAVGSASAAPRVVSDAGTGNTLAAGTVMYWA